MAASTVSIYFQGDPRGAVQATKAVEAQLGSLKSVTGEVEQTTGRASSGIRQHWGAISLAAGGALTAITIAGKRAGDAASDLGEQVNKTRVVFRGSEQDILQWSESTARGLGISQRAALEAAGTFGNMLVPMGIARARAGDMSKTFVGLAADMASFNNASPEETLDALRAGLAGETEPLRRFGVFLNQARIEEEALRLGLVKEGEALTAAQKAQATYSIILKDTSDAQGDFARTSDSVANSERIKAAVQEDSAAKLGTVVLPVMQAYNQILAAAAGFAADHSTAAQILVGALVALAGAVITVNAGMAVYRAYTIASAAASAVWAQAQWLLNAALTANPIGVVVVALAALVAGIILAWRESETFRRIVTGAFNAVRGAAEFVLDFFREHWKTIAILITGPFAPVVALATDAFGIRSAIVNAFEAIMAFVGRAIDNLVGLFRRVVDVVEAINAGLRWLRDNAGKIIAKLADVAAGPLGVLGAAFERIAGALAAIRGLIGYIIDKAGDVVGAVSKIADAASKVGGLIGKIPGLQHGGPVEAGRMYIVGEGGPELFVGPPGGGFILPNPVTESLLTPRALGLSDVGRVGIGGDTYLTVHAHVHADGFLVGGERELGERLAQHVGANLKGRLGTNGSEVWIQPYASIESRV